MLRHKVKPGITGWAQVHNLRQDTSIEKRLEYDFYYIQNWSFTLDIKILWMTLRQGLHRQEYVRPQITLRPWWSFIAGGRDCRRPETPLRPAHPCGWDGIDSPLQSA